MDKRPIPIYFKRDVLLAFEFGVLLSEASKDLKMVLTPEIMERAEKIFMSEIRKNGFEKTARNFQPLLLACFEV